MFGISAARFGPIVEKCSFRIFAISVGDSDLLSFFPFIFSMMT